jgi:hypothetical protein
MPQAQWWNESFFSYLVLLCNADPTGDKRLKWKRIIYKAYYAVGEPFPRFYGFVPSL